MYRSTIFYPKAVLVIIHVAYYNNMPKLTYNLSLIDHGTMINW